MIISSRPEFNNNNKLVSFKSDTVNRAEYNSNYADTFVKEVNEIVDKQKKGDFFSRYIWSVTAFIPSALLIIPYEIYMIHKMNKLDKVGNLEALKLARGFFKKVFPLLTA